ncbi:MAG: class I SAM-dependent methyltransferase [Pseudomonadota bacterium]|nr:class I SAM-dependent methyltransferase [Pseudomonadota bacterium]
MKKLKNWDNKTWLSSKNYIYQFSKFLNQKIRFNKNTKILDIGCGRANIISALQNRYKFKEKPIGLDIVKNKGIKRNIIFKKIDGHDYLKRKKEKYDLILLKQTIHFLSPSKLKVLINIAKKRLKHGGKLLIFSLKTKNNKIPCFKKMRQKLDNSLNRDEKLFKIIKKKLKRSNESYFNFKVNISKQKYIKMVKSRYISCLLDLKNNEILRGINELKSKYKYQIKFTDTLKCISYKN